MTDMDTETSRRLYAAIAYATRGGRTPGEPTQADIAAKLDIDNRTLTRWKETGRMPRPSVNLPLIAIACDLPPSFFHADFEQLHKLVPDGSAEAARDDAVAAAQRRHEREARSSARRRPGGALDSSG